MAENHTKSKPTIIETIPTPEQENWLYSKSVQNVLLSIHAFLCCSSWSSRHLATAHMKQTVTEIEFRLVSLAQRLRKKQVSKHLFFYVLNSETRINFFGILLRTMKRDNFQILLRNSETAVNFSEWLVRNGETRSACLRHCFETCSGSYASLWGWWPLT